MAFYEMLPGAGMPSGLQAGMDSVLNKKFGTSTTYPAAGWPDDVNLLGLLEEKTVSGSIAHFDDGADAVPLKSLVANLPASLTPYEEVEITHAGKNLFDKDNPNEVDGYIDVSSFNSNNVRAKTIYVPIKGGATYTVSKTVGARFSIATSGVIPSSGAVYTSRQAGNTSASLTITASASDKYLWAWVYLENTDTISLAEMLASVQIEAGSTASSYEPYQEPTIYDVEFPNPNPNLRQTADIDDGMWNTDGTIHTSSGGGFGRAFTMAVSEKTTYDIYGLLDDLIVYLDSNKTMLSYERLSNTALSLQNERKTTPANCAYIGLSALAFDVSSVSVKESFLVYGGSIDVVNGQGESTHNTIDMGSLSWNYHAPSGNLSAYFDTYLPNDAKVGNNQEAFDGVTDDYTSIKSSQIALSGYDDMVMALGNGTRRFFLCDQRYSDASALTTALTGKMLAYPLATAEPFNVEPIAIDSKAGTNNIWNDSSGDTEVTYRSQGTTTPILPTLVTKTITENGTYSAEDDDADGFSEVTVNVDSIAKIGINSGKLNIADGTLTSDSAWCYTDPFDCPSGMITMDFGESDSNVGIELVYASDNSHANYWTCGNGLRYREVDISSYYSPTKKARLSFKKQYLSKVLLMDFGNGKIYSSLTASQFEEET